MKIEAKICGLTDPVAVETAMAGGARHIGLVFFPKSPRNIAPPAAAELSRMASTTTSVVGLFVDPADAFLEEVVTQVPLNILQLHGKESPARVAEIRARWNTPVMKAISLATADDLAEVPAYEAVADRLLFDAKLPPGVLGLPGGNGLPFDWTLLAGRQFAKPWMLAGGLNPENVVAAVQATGATAVDVSSGIEDRPGHKSPARISAFLDALRTL
jgi:phosphoribosylanthranilate isomerase